jgi:hypothetical protein
MVAAKKRSVIFCIVEIAEDFFGYRVAKKTLRPSESMLNAVLRGWTALLYTLMALMPLSSNVVLVTCSGVIGKVTGETCSGATGAT